MDRSSFIHGGTRYAGVAGVGLDSVIWASTVPPETSAQMAELIVPTQALKLAKEAIADIYKDSRYAFATTHVHGAIYKERGLLTAEGKTIYNKEEILAWSALWLPLKVAFTHCLGYQTVTWREALLWEILKNAIRNTPAAPGGHGQPVLILWKLTWSLKISPPSSLNYQRRVATMPSPCLKNPTAFWGALLANPRFAATPFSCCHTFFSGTQLSRCMKENTTQT